MMNFPCFVLRRANAGHRLNASSWISLMDYPDATLSDRVRLVLSD